MPRLNDNPPNTRHVLIDQREGSGSTPGPLIDNETDTGAHNQCFSEKMFRLFLREPAEIDAIKPIFPIKIKIIGLF
jgi:hypothetical protein